MARVHGHELDPVALRRSSGAVFPGVVAVVHGSAATATGSSGTWRPPAARPSGSTALAARRALGELPEALVTLKPGAGAAEREIIEYRRGRLARFERPAAVELGELPKTPTGKIQKHALRERTWTGEGRRTGG